MWGFPGGRVACAKAPRQQGAQRWEEHKETCVVEAGEKRGAGGRVDGAG